MRNLKTNRLLKGSILSSYQYINFKWNGKQKNKAVHRLVAETFLPNPENKPLVDHIDGDRLNNNLDNLRWVTPQENAVNIHLDKTPQKPELLLPLLTEEDIAMEQWETINGLLVSTLGKIKGKRGNLLKGTYRVDGYLSYMIDGKSYLGHILVWEAFKGKKLPKWTLTI